MPQAQLSLKKKILFTACLTLITLALALAVGEIYVRRTSAYGYVTPEIIRQRSLHYAPSVFARTVFPQEAQTAYGGKTVYDNLIYPINAKGYRGPDFALPKPANTIRIIIYGGSQVFDVVASGENDWPRRVEKVLRQQGLANVEVINAGVPGHASWDSVGKLFAEGHTLQPDYVILCNAWNDIKGFTNPRPLLRQFAPYTVTADPRQNYQNSVDRFLSEHSQLFVRLRTNYYGWKLRAGTQGQIPETTAEATAQGIAPSALQQYRLNLQTFSDIAKNTGSVPVLMTQPRLAAATNSAEEKSRLHYHYVNLTHEGLLDAFAQTDALIRRTAQEKSVPLIDAAPRLTGRGDLFTDEVHYNDAGSQAVAELVAGELARIIKAR